MSCPAQAQDHPQRKHRKLVTFDQMQAEMNQRHECDAEREGRQQRTQLEITDIIERQPPVSDPNVSVLVPTRRRTRPDRNTRAAFRAGPGPSQHRSGARARAARLHPALSRRARHRAAARGSTSMAEIPLLPLRARWR